MNQIEREMLEKYRERNKRQNEAAKDRWDTISCRLPKGTKERIKSLGLTTNGLINDLVLSELDRLEAVAEQTPTEPAQDFSDVPFMN